MKEFFKVTPLEQVLEAASQFSPLETETVPLEQSLGRVMAETVVSDGNLPEFPRSTMDGFAVSAASTFGASEGAPAYLQVVGSVTMGNAPAFSIKSGEACRIGTGGMLPKGADSVVMVEHTAALDETTIEVVRSVAPGQHVQAIGEDYRSGQTILEKGKRLRPQETGLLAAFGQNIVRVYRRPVVGIISTGDEVIPIERTPGPGQIRDINSFTLSDQVHQAGGLPRRYGIVGDDYQAIHQLCRHAVDETDMVLISGGSSMGTRDFTVEVFSRLAGCRIMFHGISISPGKPTILAALGNKVLWGLPGQVVSAMVVFRMVVQPFLERLAGLGPRHRPATTLPARLSRNIASAQGRTDFVRVRLLQENGERLAVPVLGKSGLINTMVKADGLIEVDINTEGLDQGALVEVLLL